METLTKCYHHNQSENTCLKLTTRIIRQYLGDVFPVLLSVNSNRYLPTSLAHKKYFNKHLLKVKDKNTRTNVYALCFGVIIIDFDLVFRLWFATTNEHRKPLNVQKLDKCNYFYQTCLQRQSAPKNKNSRYV